MKRYLLFNPNLTTKNKIENEIETICTKSGGSIKSIHDKLKSLTIEKSNQEYQAYLKNHKMSNNDYGTLAWFNYDEIGEIVKNRCFMKIYEEQLDTINMFKTIYEKVYKPEFGKSIAGELIIDKIKNLKEYEIIEITRKDLKEFGKKLIQKNKTNQKRKGIKP